MTRERKVPKLRFKDFTNDWKQRKLGEEVNFYSGLTYHPKDVRNNGVFVIRSSNIKDGRLVRADDVFVEPTIAKSNRVKPKDIIVVVRNGSKKLIGKHAQIKKEVPNTVIGAFMTGVRSAQNDFINSLFDSEEFRREIQKNLGATINQITTGEFKKMVFYFPNEEEQKPIGNLINKVDKIISLQQRKLYQLKMLKKGFLQNLLPDSGAIVPKIRFKGFTNNWKQQKIKQYVISDQAGQYIPKNQLGKGISFIGVQDLYDKDYITENNIFRLAPVKDKKFKLKKGDLLYAESSLVLDGIGKTVFVKNFNKPLAFAWHTRKFVVNKDVDPSFLAFSINYKHHNYLIRVATQTALTGITKKDFFNNVISLTSIKEQQRISAIIEKIDKIMVLQQQKIDQFKQFKKFLLQNMFI